MPRSRLPWRRLDRTTVHEARWLSVCQDQVVRPDGEDHVYHHVVLPASATVLAVSDDGRVPVTRQWIYTHEDSHWRLPTGGIDAVDAGWEDAAKRELREETGLIAGTWQQLGTVNGADSATNHRDHVFIATDLIAGQPRLGGDEADLEVRWFNFREVLDMVLSGSIRHAGSAFAVLTAAIRWPEKFGQSDGRFNRSPEVLVAAGN